MKKTETPVSIMVTREVVEALWNGARALDLIHTLEEADSDKALGQVEVLLEMTSQPAWAAAHELMSLYQAAGGK